MSNDSGRDVALFTEALRLPIEQRAVFLERACAGDEELRRKVEALLEAHERAGDFLETPPIVGESGAWPNDITEDPSEGAGGDGDGPGFNGPV
jgi:serine/threonine-protein kinase